MENKPKTKKECFAQLDEMLSEADKKAIVEAEDLFEFHFTLGLWIRNNWLYDRSEEERSWLCKVNEYRSQKTALCMAVLFKSLEEES